MSKFVFVPDSRYLKKEKGGLFSLYKHVLYSLLGEELTPQEVGEIPIMLAHFTEFLGQRRLSLSVWGIVLIIQLTQVNTHVLSVYNMSSTFHISLFKKSLFQRSFRHTEKLQKSIVSIYPISSRLLLSYMSMIHLL